MRLFFFFSEMPYYKEGDKVEFHYTFLSEPKSNSYGKYFFANGMLVSYASEESFGYGDRVIISGKVGTQKSSKGEELLTIKNPKMTRQGRGKVLAIIGVIRQKVIDAFEKVLPPKESGLFLGIVLGIKDKIDPAYYEQLKSVGILHVVAASGSNVALVASFLLSFFQNFVKRKHAILFTVLGIAFYSLISGFDPPIVRSTIMATVAFVSLVFGRQNASVRALILTVIIMLVSSPGLISDVGFQLSAASTLGILYLKPLFDMVFKYKFLSLVRDDLGTTLAAQLATLPIMLVGFSSYSLVSVISNLLLLWTIPPLMVLGLAASMVSLLWWGITAPILYLAHPFLLYFERVVDIFSSSKQFEAGNIPVVLIIGYYGVLISTIFLFTKNKKEK